MELLPTKIVSEFFNDEELLLLESLIDNDNTPMETGWDKTARIDSIRYVANPPAFKQLINRLSPRLSQVLGQTPVFNAIWKLKEFHPFGFHTDYKYFPADCHDNLYYTIIIPLITANTRTILANEHGDVNDFPVYKKHATPVKNHLSPDFFKQHLSHCNIDQMMFFTHSETFEWQRGSLLAFDRRRWHASDNFIKNGLEYKEAIVSFTRI